SLDLWFPMFARGEVSLYVSDGDPSTVTVPNPLPADLEGQLDPAVIAAQGHTLLRYDVTTGELLASPAGT
ncbi:MAG: hypothetical protein ACTHQE_05525, partial [Thermomicrobiales bacterium]